MREGTASEGVLPIMCGEIEKGRTRGRCRRLSAPYCRGVLQGRALTGDAAPAASATKNLAGNALASRRQGQLRLREAGTQALSGAGRVGIAYLTVMVIRRDITGGSCGMCIRSPMINCKVCLPGASSIVVSVWPPPKCL